VCGICGILNLDSAQVDDGLIAVMNQSLVHRGPDGHGQFTSGPIGLGHRRLAIVDLTATGSQPMSTACGRFVISYNGEIYNYLDLRTELQSKGHKFHSRSDTEVLLRSWLEWGSACIPKLNGMFAIAIWDAQEKQLTLVRDKYGIKPLYYAMFGRSFVFGSEQRAILQHPAATHHLDRTALVEYLTFQNIISDRTLNEAIRILPAGHILQLRIGEHSPRIHEYWDFHFGDSANFKDHRDLEDELEFLIRQAVHRQLKSDVEVGSYLSGGLDSGTIAVLAREKCHDLKTFTCGFDTSDVVAQEAHYDERAAARQLATRLGTRHYEVEVGPRDFEAFLETVATQLEEPRVGQSYPNYLVAKLASEQVKVVLSGTGADEMFGGYTWRYEAALDSPDRQTFVEKYFNCWNRLFKPHELRKLLSPIWHDVADFDVRELFETTLCRNSRFRSSETSFLNDCFYFEAKTFLHGLLVVEDKLSMAHGLETRLPFLDDDVVNFAMRCPVGLKVSRNKVSPSWISSPSTENAGPSVVGKRILRRVLEGIIGEDFLRLRKQGFSAPDSAWFSNQCGNFVQGKLDNKLDFFDYNTHLSSNGENRVRLDNAATQSRLLTWSLLNLQILCRGSFIQ
jgi:asparagine synthase (glutamine-hydrolysing)